MRRPEAPGSRPRTAPPARERGGPVELTVPGSKSLTLRALVAAALAAGHSPLEGPLELTAGESGAVLRFLLALCARGRGSYRIATRGRLAARPIDDLAAALAAAGARLTAGTRGWSVRAGERGSAFTSIALPAVRS